VGFVSDKFSKRILITISLGFCVISLILLGPSYYLDFPNQLWIMIVGLALQGACVGCMLILVLPEIIETLYLKYNIRDGENKTLDGIISDKAAGLYGSFYSIGMIISPLMGSWIFEKFYKAD
jgi:MFS family permease